MMRKIMTSFQRKPVETRAYDWLASFEDSTPDDCLVGFGETEQEAIDDLIDKAAASEPFPAVPSGAYS